MVVARRERPRANAANHIWTLDFVSDQLVSGMRFRVLTVVDVFSSEALAIEVGQRLKKAGFAHHLVKPVDPETLMALLA